MAKQASTYHRGEMDISEQVATYEFVMKLTKWGSLSLAALLLFLVLQFCVGAGFIGAAGTAAVLAVVGFFVLRSPAEAH